MAEQAQHTVADLMTMYKATFFELPLAGTQWAWGVGKEQEAAEAAWKGYDAWVRLTSTSIDELYRNSLFGEIAARALDSSLRWQRFSNAWAGTFFGGLWPAVGLPTAAAVQALQEGVQSLTVRLKAQDAQIQALRTELRSLAADLPTQRKRRAPSTRLDASLKALPARMNGHQTGTFPTPSA
ncbi:MAG TPA: hypothetical protein VGX03_04350 [Candidatus Binatia bacterium]|nr:hypothetical protein [Candidatus Binatia bacterium]